MTKEKANRIAAAVTVNVVLLIVVLVAVVVYQMVQITVIERRRNEIINQINYYEQQIEESEDYLKYLQSEEALRDLAFEYGYRYSD